MEIAGARPPVKNITSKIQIIIDYQWKNGIYEAKPALFQENQIEID